MEVSAILVAEPGVKASRSACCPTQLRQSITETPVEMEAVFGGGRLLWHDARATVMARPKMDVRMREPHVGQGGYRAALRSGSRQLTERSANTLKITEVISTRWSYPVKATQT